MTAADFLPQRRTITALGEAAVTCRGCSLYRKATQTVFGEGRTSAEVVMVDEQPGDQEDRRGKRRIHKRPAAAEVAACRPWFEAELQAIKPTALLALGATAAQDLFGRSFRVTKQRGRPLDSELAPLVMASVHPSSILRAPDDESRREEYELFVADLRALADGLRELREAF